MASIRLHVQARKVGNRVFRGPSLLYHPPAELLEAGEIEIERLGAYTAPLFRVGPPLGKQSLHFARLYVAVVLEVAAVNNPPDSIRYCVNVVRRAAFRCQRVLEVAQVVRK